MNRLAYKFTMLLAVAALLGACGGSSTKKVAAGKQGIINPPPPPPWPTPTGTPNPNLSAPFTYSGTISGQNTFTQQSPPTDSKLLIKIQPTAGANVNVPGYENFSFTPQCMRFKVTVLGQTVQTNYIRVTGTSGWPMCQGAPDSQVIDFSGRLGSGGPGIIQVSNSQYDIYCQLFARCYYYGGTGCSAILNAYSFVCPVKNVLPQHTVNFNLIIGTNYTNDP